MNNITLVTGATGFIGSHLTDALVARGETVRCLVRSTSDVRYLKTLGVELVYGDLRDEASLIAAVKGVSTVYHLAAQVRPHKPVIRRGELNDLYTQVNATGTGNIARAASAQGVSKFIHFSSIAVVGEGLGISESSPCSPITDYGRSKLQAEEIVISLVKNKNLPATIIRPGQIYGPRCLAMRMFFKLVKCGLFLTIGRGDNYVPLCYVDDLIAGALLVEEKGRIGETYLIFEKPYTFRQFIQAIAQATGGSCRKVYFPRNIAYAGVCLKELCESIFRLRICPFCMDIGRKGIIAISATCSGSIDKAKTELGYYPSTDLGKGTVLTANWYKDKGLL